MCVAFAPITGRSVEKNVLSTSNLVFYRIPLVGGLGIDVRAFVYW